MMAYGHTTGSGFMFFGLLHFLGSFLFFIGVLFLLFWAFKHFSEAQLRKRGMHLVIAGVVLSLFGALVFPLAMMERGEKFGGGMKMMHDMDDDSMEMMDSDPMSMSMHDMSSMLDGKTGDDFDRAFLQGMIPHHQGAIDMAEMAMKHAKHPEIRAMATAIIEAQQKEIDAMNAWGTSWGYTQ